MSTENRFSERQKLKFGGIQTICSDSSGTDKSHILICDTQSNVLKYSKASLMGEEAPEEFIVKDESTGAISWHGDNVCAGLVFIDFVEGTDDRYVGLFNTNLEKSKNLIKFQAKVTVLDVNQEFVVAGSSDSTIKWAKLSDHTNTQSLDLNGKVLSIKIDPKNEFVAVSTADGVITILTIENFEVVQVINDLFEAFDYAEASTPRITLSWSKNGEVLFVPSNGSVKRIERNTWHEISSLQTKDESQIFSTTCVSRNAQYLAASTMNNELVVWEIATKKIVSSAKYTAIEVGENVIVAICFAPFSDDIVVVDSKGKLCVYKTEVSNKVVEIEEEEEDEDSIILNKTSNVPKIDFDDNDDNSRMSEDISEIKKKYGFFNTDPIDFENIDAEPPKKMEEIQILDQKMENIDYSYSKMKQKKNMIPEQFVSGSTPFEGVQKCLKYNQYGFVRLYIDERAKINTIDIEYHDKSKYADNNLDNFDTNYEMADISSKAIVLASYMNAKKEKKKSNEVDELTELKNEEEKFEEGTSALHVIPTSAFGKQEWTVKMRKGEGIVDVLASETQIFAITSLRNVRIFSMCGIQRMIFNHPAPILTCACFNNTLAIASAAGGQFVEKSAKETELWKIELTEYTVDNKTWFRESNTPTKIDVPIKNGEELDWLSYSRNGKIVVMDTSYTVHILSPAKLWIPIFEGPQQDKEDGLFAIQVVEGKKSGEFRYMKCKGRKYPMFDGREIIEKHKWQAPFCQANTDRAENEQELFFNELAICDALADVDSTEIDKLDKEHLATIVKLFSLSVKSNADGRSAELASLVTSSKGIGILANYANKHKKMALAEKVAEIGREMVKGPSSTSKTEDDEFIRPRKIVTGKKEIEMDKKSSSSFVSTLEAFKNRERLEEAADISLDDSMQDDPFDSQASAPAASRLGGINPFKKRAEETSSSSSKKSVFDQLENIPITVSTMKDRKRGREEGEKTTVRKQAKLAFSSSSASSQIEGEPEKEKVVEKAKKGVTPYDLWLEEATQSLKPQFSGEESDFSKFCIQKFRALTKEQKEEWKNKAQELNA